MIWLKKNSVNTFVCTASDLRLNEGDSFYLEFVHDQEKKVYSITLNNISDFPYRYDKFSITLPDDLALKFEGDYRYYIYENDTKENLLEVGKMTLEGEPRDNKTNNVATGDNYIHDDKQD